MSLVDSEAPRDMREAGSIETAAQILSGLTGIT